MTDTIAVFVNERRVVIPRGATAAMAASQITSASVRAASIIPPAQRQISGAVSFDAPIRGRCAWIMRATLPTSAFLIAFGSPGNTNRPPVPAST